MPIYEFSCSNCRRRFETLVSIGGEKDLACILCGSRDIQKLFSSFGIGGGSSRIKSSSEACGSCTSHSCATCKS